MDFVLNYSPSTFNWVTMIIIIQFRFSAVSGTQDAIECSRFGLAFPKYLPKFDIIEE